MDIVLKDKAYHHRKWYKKFSIYLICGWMSLLVGTSLALYAWEIVKFAISSVFVLNYGSWIYRIWEHPPDPNICSMYFFNWTNSHELYNSSVKPKFQEIGPYIFEEHLNKVNVVVNDNDTFTYRLVKSYKVSPDNSKNLNDNITTLNLLAAVMAEKVKDWNYFYKRTMSFGLTSLSTKMAIHKTVNEISFKGYEDEIINMVKKLPSFITSSNGVEMMDKFGWFLPINGSAIAHGLYNVGTGHKYHLSDLLNWNYKNDTAFAASPCNKVTGITGEMFKRPAIQDKLVMFSPEACRYLTLEYVEDEEAFGIPCRKYKLGAATLDNGTKVAENKCFCEGNCLPSGVMDVSRCLFGAPVVLSLPHFYDADPFYLQDIEGLKPDKSKHEFTVHVEPVSGLPVKVTGRLQLSTLVQPVDDITIYGGLPKFYFPLMWMTISGKIPNFILMLLRFVLFLPTIFLIVGSTLSILGLILLTKATYLILVDNVNLVKCEKQETQPLNS